MEGEGVATGRSAVLQPTAAEIFVLADAGASCAAASFLHGRIGKIDLSHNRVGEQLERHVLYCVGPWVASGPCQLLRAGRIRGLRIPSTGCSRVCRYLIIIIDMT